MTPTRRDVLQAGSALALGSGLKPLPIINRQAVKICAPLDKERDAAYFLGLREKGMPMRAEGAALKWVGMPVGGICAGQLYLGGDGRLWHWDIFNQPPARPTQNGPAYEHPVDPDSGPMLCRFFVEVDGGDPVPLDSTGFPDTSWSGQWPVGRVEHRGGGGAVEIDLEALSPFSPLDAEASGMPATFLVYRIHNRSANPIQARIAAELENPVLKWSGSGRAGTRRSLPLETGKWRGILLDAVLAKLDGEESRDDVVIESWDNGYAGWTSSGTAFGSGPQEVAKMPAYQGDVKATTRFVVNSHNVRSGEDVAAGDAHQGRLTSSTFIVERPFLSFQIGGGNHPNETCLNLWVDGEIVRTQTGRDSNEMRWESWNVAELVGLMAHLEIVDAASGAWGNVGIGEICLADAPKTAKYAADQQGDWGTMCLLCDAVMDAPLSRRIPFDEPANERLSGERRIESGESVEIRFVLAWHFANPWRQSISALEDSATFRRWYSTKWSNAASVAAEAASKFEELRRRTLAWNHAWYEGSLPYWFLERTLIPADALATATSWRFDNGRFYGWEGTYCCPGTCTHVWGYAQSVGHLFPELERSLRRDVDFGLAWRPDGSVDYRGEYGRSVAHDGQCTLILRTMREHLRAPDADFLRGIWPRVRASIERLVADDKDRDGLLEGAQYNTLDATWFGPMGWISSLYIAALAAGERMAQDMGDAQFAVQCRNLANRGRQRIGEVLFNGEYFVHKPDPAHPEANSTNDGCHIDQVFGASWLRQMGMDGELDQGQVRSALRSLWTYNFLPDVGPYRRAMKAVEGGRWYAMPGEAGLLMCSWPKGGAERAVGRGGEAWAAGYFNECMNGFEWHVAAHMIAEDMVDEGLTIVRALHDRYAPEKRNPYNEIECGDHYARSMASHGAFLTACGFEFDGPRQIMGFAPKFGSESFSCAWTGSEGWGTFQQERTGDAWQVRLRVLHGSLTLKELRLGMKFNHLVKASHLLRDVDCRVGGSSVIFPDGITIPSGTTLTLNG